MKLEGKKKKKKRPSTVTSKKRKGSKALLEKHVSDAQLIIFLTTVLLCAN